MAATSIPINQQQQAISSAAHAYGVPVSVLWGVYGIETDFGRNIATSSAGAQGPFQFIPSTAKSLGYPLTNTPSYPQFWSQAQSAAKYLQQLFQQTGSWEKALQHYSGGGYGLSQVTAKATSAESKSLSGQGFYPGLIASEVVGGLLAGAGGGAGAAGAAGAEAAGAAAGDTAAGGVAGGAAGTAAKVIGGAGGTLAKDAATATLAAMLTSSAFWIRIGEGILGAALLLLGLRALTGGSGNPVELARKVAR